MLAAALCLWLCCGRTARADDDIKVSAAVADDDVDVGQEVDFTINVEGTNDAQVPEIINVDGLLITYVGPSSQTQIMFGWGLGGGGHFEQSVVHTYSIVPQRAGDYVIPAQDVVVNGKHYTTQEVKLRVGGGGSSGAGGAAGGGGAADAGTGNGALYFAEFVVPQDTAYIGEAVPIEVRIYVDRRVTAQLLELPEIKGEGFTVQKIDNKPVESEVTRNGQTYDMVSYKTAITGIKAGTLSLGPATLVAEAQLPVASPRRRLGGMFDDFPDPFGQMMQQMSPPQQIKITAQPVQITVKPLPAEGQPPSFSGAVGNFTLTATAKPGMVEAGDPITITAMIEGTGDFDRVTAPEFADASGWRTYPPSVKFDGDDDVGISGTKTFQIAVIPQAGQTKTPDLVWSYFDPEKGQYVTLTGKGSPVKVEGAAQPVATPVMAAQGGPSAAPTPKPAVADIAYIRADSDGWGRTFEPVYENRLFWAAQGGPLVALLAFVGVQVVRKRAADGEARLRAQWRREKDAALATMQRRDVPEGELYEAAARALRLDAAIQTGRAPETLDGTEVARARELDTVIATQVRRLFDQQAEVLYAGASGRRVAASPQARVDVMETVKGYENAKPAV